MDKTLTASNSTEELDVATGTTDSETSETDQKKKPKWTKRAAPELVEVPLAERKSPYGLPVRVIKEKKGRNRQQRRLFKRQAKRFIRQLRDEETPKKKKVVRRRKGL